MHPDATGIAVANASFAEGAERIVFLMTEIDKDSRAVGLPLVAKHSLYKQKQSDLKYLRMWHRTFVKTQMKAAKHAVKFNQRLDNLGVSKGVPRIRFLDCSVYECTPKPLAATKRNATAVAEFACLAEKRLNPECYVKWNNNAGAVDGIGRNNDRQYEDLKVDVVQSKRVVDLGGIEEGDEEEEDDDDDDDDGEGHEDEVGKTGVVVITPKTEVMELEKRVLEGDIPQAFTHFSYKWTKRDEMVCDIQGELNVKQSPAIFELTDPCIHSYEGRKYGRTDKGYHGVELFFKTHQCNAVCKLLGIQNRSYEENS